MLIQCTNTYCISRSSVPPQILNENDDGSRREILSKEGETVNVICNVSGIPPPSVKWYRRPLEDTLGSKKESKRKAVSCNIDEIFHHLHIEMKHGLVYFSHLCNSSGIR